MEWPHPEGPSQLDAPLPTPKAGMGSPSPSPRGQLPPGQPQPGNRPSQASLPLRAQESCVSPSAGAQSQVWAPIIWIHHFWALSPLSLFFLPAPCQMENPQVFPKVVLPDFF